MQPREVVLTTMERKSVENPIGWSVYMFRRERRERLLGFLRWCLKKGERQDEAEKSTGSHLVD
jgi:hypothetical protein